MNIQYGAKRMFMRPMHTMYAASILCGIKVLDFNYVTKVVYNKEKDVIFVYRPSGFWFEKENVYEVHHLEREVPTNVSSWEDMSSQKDDGIVTVKCLATQEILKFYNEDKYWNIDEKENFMRETGHHWEGYVDKNRGSHFFTPEAKYTPEEMVNVSRWFCNGVD